MSILREILTSVSKFIFCKKKRIEFDDQNIIHLFKGENITDPHIQEMINAKKNKTEPAVVIEILGDNRLVLNVGSNKNVEVGLNFDIYRLGNEIFDPKTNLSLGILEILQAQGVVESVQENMCILKPVLKVTEFILSDMPNEKFPFLQTNKQKLTTKEPTSFKNVKIGDFAKCSLYRVSYYRVS